MEVSIVSIDDQENYNSFNFVHFAEFLPSFYPNLDSTSTPPL